MQYKIYIDVPHKVFKKKNNEEKVCKSLLFYIKKKTETSNSLHVQLSTLNTYELHLGKLEFLLRQVLGTLKNASSYHRTLISTIWYVFEW